MCSQQSFQVLILMSLLIGFCRSQSNLRPAVCSQAKPKNTKCLSDERDRRWFFHSTKGCKRSGFCKSEVEKYDNQTDLNYFLSERDCRQTCMTDIRCPDLEPIPNGLRTKGGMGTWGTSIMYSCNEGYSLVGPSVRRCLMNATWSATTPMCRVKCPEPSVADLANVRFAPMQRFYKQGDVIFYDCIKPYFGHSSRMCLTDGSWSGAEPNCELQSVRCPEPRLLVHGSVYAPSQTVGSVSVYTCNSDYMLYGNNTRECNESGQWSGQIPICWKPIIELHNNSEDPIDITNQVIELTIGMKNIWIIAGISKPHPFQIGDRNWIFHGSQSSNLYNPGLDFLGSRIKVNTILKSKEQEGNYTIYVRDYEVFFTLVVKEAVDPIPTEKPYLLLGPVNTSTTLGCNIELSCVFRGSPSPDVTWYHNNTLVTSDARREYTQQQQPSIKLTTSTLNIYSVRQSDLGNYVCEGSNQGGSLPSLPAEITNQRISCPVKNSRHKKRSLQRISLCSSTSPSDTVTIVGRVKRELTRLRAPGSTVYRLHVRSVLHGSTDKNISQRNIRTIVIDTNSSTRLKRNGRYLLQGRIQDNTLLVYGHDSILSHTAELERSLHLC